MWPILQKKIHNYRKFLNFAEKKVRAIFVSEELFYKPTARLKKIVGLLISLNSENDKNFQKFGTGSQLSENLKNDKSYQKNAETCVIKTLMTIPLTLATMQ